MWRIASFSTKLSLVVLVAFSYNACAQCPGQADYDKTESNSDRLTTILEGNFTIQALITMTEERSNKKCHYVNREGVVRAFAMNYAIQKFNSNPKYAEYAKIGLQIDDVCQQLPTTMARGIEVISFHRKNSVCRADFLKCDAKPLNSAVKIQRASALIGTAMSFTTIPLASLMSLYSIPQVSPASSSRLLSKRDLYKSFFRTIPSDKNQIKAMLKVFKRFDWNYIFAVGSDDDYGKLGVSDLKQEAGPLEICITKDEYIPYQSDKTGEKVDSVIQKIAKEEKAKVVVLFLYVQGLGDLILQKAAAMKPPLERIWLTSESWNPSAAIHFSSNISRYYNQAVGILSISIKKYPMTELVDYMTEQVIENWECNFWFRKYIQQNKPFECNIDSISLDKNTFICKPDTNGKVKNISVAAVLTDIKKLPGNIDRLIDATTALGHAIHKVVRTQCNNSPCYIDTENLETASITKQMFKTNFTNEQGEIISFTKDGNPLNAYYTIENLIFNNETGAFEYVPVGHWALYNNSRTELKLNESAIVWPQWFNNSRQKTDGSGDWVETDIPASRCSDRCEPGYKVVGRSSCCWNCHACTDNNHTSHEMAEECKPCGNYHHTLDNIRCLETPIKWLKIDDPAGLSIVIISCLGILASIATCIFMYRFWELVTVHEKSKHLLTFVCVLLFFTFGYGPLHIIEPTLMFCSVRNGYFFVLLMIYTSFVLTKTQAMCSNIQYYCDKFFRGNMTATQGFVLFLFVLLELASIVAWIYLDDKQIREFRTPGIHLIEKQCEVEFTAARLVSTFIPCIILIIATFCAFRERNADHSFYEPKFLSFSCIALCIIIVAFLPTFRYVDGVYKAVVLAFTMNVFGFTFIACLILPKVYVGIIRKKRGIQEYPMKPGVTKKEKKEKREKKKAEKAERKRQKKEAAEKKEKPEISTTMTSSFKTKSTAIEEGVSEMDTKRDPEAALDEVEIKEKTAEEIQEEEAGYNNETYDDDEVEIQTGSPPPSYESSINRKDDDLPNTKC
ncbi:metabotropic glutamate receptor 3-like [Clytia hemisphaerica]|uniref:G-protein coupled receptors family 3 profile domain-containing protein n=1 Tax=Clytia hemisphaerica TaxID=252671 RepID=A0A7M5V0Y9_9CNID